MEKYWLQKTGNPTRTRLSKKTKTRPKPDCRSRTQLFETRYITNKDAIKRAVRVNFWKNSDYKKLDTRPKPVMSNPNPKKYFKNCDIDYWVKHTKYSSKWIFPLKQSNHKLTGYHSNSIINYNDAKNSKIHQSYMESVPTKNFLIYPILIHFNVT